MDAFVKVFERLRLEGEGPPVEADTVPAVDKKPFINLRSFCRFFFPPGPGICAQLETVLYIQGHQGTSFLFFCW